VSASTPSDITTTLTDLAAAGCYPLLDPLPFLVVLLADGLQLSKILLHRFCEYVQRFTSLSQYM